MGQLSFRKFWEFRTPRYRSSEKTTVPLPATCRSQNLMLLWMSSSADHEESVRGWERAVDAQRRIIAGTKAVLRAKSVDGDVAIIAHGGTGTLLLCHLAGVPISRDWDQPRTNGGNFFAFDLMTFRLLHGWRSIDTQHVTSYQKREERTK